MRGLLEESREKEEQFFVESKNSSIEVELQCDQSLTLNSLVRRNDVSQSTRSTLTNQINSAVKTGKLSQHYYILPRFWKDQLFIFILPSKDI